MQFWGKGNGGKTPIAAFAVAVVAVAVVVVVPVVVVVVVGGGGGGGGFEVSLSLSKCSLIPPPFYPARRPFLIFFQDIFSRAIMMYLWYQE